MVCRFTSGIFCVHRHTESTNLNLSCRFSEFFPTSDNTWEVFFFFSTKGHVGTELPDLIISLMSGCVDVEHKLRFPGPPRNKEKLQRITGERLIPPSP